MATRLGFSGFLEFEEADDIDLYFDVDCGPVIARFSFTANAFGVGASRANARYDHAYPLTLQMLATSWPLPNGALLVPRTLSDGTDAPYLGEAAILYNLTRNPPSELIITKARNEPKAPRYVLIMMLMYLLPFGLICTASTVDLVRITRKRGFRLPFPIVQAVLLVWMLSIAVFSLGIVSNVFGVMCLMGITCFPILRFEKI